MMIMNTSKIEDDNPVFLDELLNYYQQSTDCVSCGNPIRKSINNRLRKNLSMMKGDNALLNSSTLFSSTSLNAVTLS